MDALEILEEIQREYTIDATLDFVFLGFRNIFSFYFNLYVRRVGNHMANELARFPVRQQVEQISHMLFNQFVVFWY